MRRLLFAVLTVVLGSGIGIATTASAAPQASSQVNFTCAYFQNPTVELVWSHVCHF
ncbi:MAG TPA: hypothetical protein VFH54_14940 [Mycobacteriales bacterium]|nr:hypothetical protein [Mycobacteriales bacterium]